MRRLGRTSLLVLTVISCAAAQAEKGSGPDITEVLKQFPGYHLLTMAERSADASAFLLRHFSRTNASIVHADFDGDGHQDYALLLKHDGTENAKFVILLCSDDSQCRTGYELDVTATIAEMYLRPISKGSFVSQTEASDTNDFSPPTKLRGVGIQVNYFEKGAVVYYWSNKTRNIEMIDTED